MPAYYTHYLVARETLKRLPSETKKEVESFPSLYFFGAQGADFCFFYKFFIAKAPNFGSFLHRSGGFDAFTVLRLFASSQPNVFAYALGYVTHYATDSVFHPYVYAISGTSPLLHNRNESLLDAYFRQKEQDKKDVYAQYLQKKPTEAEQEDLFYVYAAIAARCGLPPLFKSSFTRAVSIFNAYLPVTNTLSKRKDDARLKQVANEAKERWRYPADESIVSNADANQLFEKAVKRSCALIKTFSQALYKKTPLPRAQFGKNYLTGL